MSEQLRDGFDVVSAFNERRRERVPERVRRDVRHAGALGRARYQAIDRLLADREEAEEVGYVVLVDVPVERLGQLGGDGDDAVLVPLGMANGDIAVLDVRRPQCEKLRAPEAREGQRENDGVVAQRLVVVGLTAGRRQNRGDLLGRMVGRKLFRLPELHAERDAVVLEKRFQRMVVELDGAVLVALLAEVSQVVAGGLHAEGT